MRSLQGLSVVIDLLFVTVLEKRAAWRAEYEAMIPAVYGQNPAADKFTEPLQFGTVKNMKG